MFSVGTLPTGRPSHALTVTDGDRIGASDAISIMVLIDADFVPFGPDDEPS